MSKLDTFHYHESLDRSWCIVDIIQTILLTHPVIHKHKKIKKQVKKARTHLINAYQMIGNKQYHKYK
ncbi:hypothetical protein M0P65_06740 [Candidatus Gracilibacteria bacterium]|jgi:hypothetical protein|nr:hypothetical protein [Candidatus Gracilibacteria bacterium]